MDKVGKLISAIQVLKPRGSILSESAYAQGKMLDHSGWDLPRKSTPSDIDAVFANGKQMIFCEFSSTWSEWCNLKYGQRKLYQDLISQLSNCYAVLARHSTPANCQIDTKEGISTWALMLNINGCVCECSAVTGFWVEFIDGFYANQGEVMASAIWKKHGK